MQDCSRRAFLGRTVLGAAASVFTRPWTLATAATTPSKPNVLVILADDMGFSDAGCYGGEIRTPNLNGLAARGLRFTQFYNTGRCWPSRASLLSGYYAQQIRRDNMTGIKRGDRPAWAQLLPKRLKASGYHAYHSGKWHIDGEPEDNGFERSWGGHRSGCDWDRFFDSQVWEEDGVRAPVSSGESYYSTVAIADHAIQCLKLHQRDHGNQPFFQYVAFYSPHFPLHALQKDIDSYGGKYNVGWDAIRQRRWQRMKTMGIVNTALSERDEDIKPKWNLKPEQLKERIGPGEAAHAVAWDQLTPEQQQFQSHKMAIHAAMITRMDTEIGRVIQQLKAMGTYDNTLILFASDNGASAEQIIRGDGHDPKVPMGSAKSYLCLGPGWSTAANTPLRLHKHWNHEGGISTPMIAHWPARLAQPGRLCHDPAHLIDIAPTVLALSQTKKTNAGPELPGKSLLPLLFGKDRTPHKHLWWCHSGNRALRSGDWKIASKGGMDAPWELYNLKKDRCEMKDLAAEYPERVKQMAKTWTDIAGGFRAKLDEQ